MDALYQPNRSLADAERAVEAAIDQAWRELVLPAQKPTLTAVMWRQGRALYKRFADAYRELLGLTRQRRRKLLRRLGVSLAGAALVLALSGTPVMHAAGITVGGSCTLFDAINAANSDTAAGGCAAGSGADIITLTSDVMLTTGLPPISSAITLEGSGHTVARADTEPAFDIFNVANIGDLVLNDTTITGGANAGIANHYGALTLNNSTVSGNSGGGIFNTGSLTLNNSTISGNGGAGVYSFEQYNHQCTTLVRNSTISGNIGPGIRTSASMLAYYYFEEPTVTLERSIIAGNTPTEVDGGLYGVVIGNNFNLIGHDGSAGSWGFTPSGSDIVPSQALSAILGPLADNGGSTKTHALLPGSPAIDAAPTGPATDQRGIARPQGAAFDIGAFELEQAANQPPVVAADHASVTVNVGQTASDTGTVSDPNGDAVTLSASAGTVVNNGNGTWSWSLATTAPGTQTITITANDGKGGVSQMTFVLTVHYAFTGFFQPVDNLPTENRVNAGQSIPVKFSLNGNQGLNILLSGYPTSQQVACPGNASVDDIEETTNSNAGLTYGGGQYNYVWKTLKSWAGTCREFSLGLKDGSSRIALFIFK